MKLFQRLCNYYVTFVICSIFLFILTLLFIKAYITVGLWGIIFVLFIFSVPLAMIIGSEDCE